MSCLMAPPSLPSRPTLSALARSPPSLSCISTPNAALRSMQPPDEVACAGMHIPHCAFASPAHMGSARCSNPPGRDRECRRLRGSCHVTVDEFKRDFGQLGAMRSSTEKRTPRSGSRWSPRLVQFDFGLFPLWSTLQLVVEWRLEVIVDGSLSATWPTGSLLPPPLVVALVLRCLRVTLDWHTERPTERPAPSRRNSEVRASPSLDLSICSVASPPSAAPSRPRPDGAQTGARIA